MNPIQDKTLPPASFRIGEKYGEFFLYLYPILIKKGGDNKVMKDETLKLMIGMHKLLNDAGKSRQLSKLYLADSAIATIRDHLKIMAFPKIGLLSQHQYGVASLKLAEVGNMIGKWIKNKKGEDG